MFSISIQGFEVKKIEHFQPSSLGKKVMEIWGGRRSLVEMGCCIEVWR